MRNMFVLVSGIEIMNLISSCEDNSNKLKRTEEFDFTFSNDKWTDQNDSISPNFHSSHSLTFITLIL